MKKVVKVVSISADNRVHNVLSTSERHCHCARLFCALPVNPRAGIPQDMCSYSLRQQRPPSALRNPKPVYARVFVCVRACEKEPG